MRRTATALMLGLFLACPQGAWGQDTSQGQVAADEEARSVRILSLGDAVGGGLGAGLLRMGEAEGRYEVTIRFNEESGLARPEVYDWAERLPKILEANSFDAIVVMLGANDRQPIKYDEQRLAFNSPEWVEAYKAQIDRLLDELIDSGARVFWVGLPPMADPDYDAALQAINAIQRERAERRGVTFLDIREAFLTPDGRYTDTGPDETGETRRLRGSDGISFFKSGNNRMGQLVLKSIAAKLGSPQAPDTGRTAPQISAVQQNSQARVVPLFGQDLLLGETLLVQPEDVTVQALIMASNDITPEMARNAILSLAVPGSAAERLFRYGDSGLAPEGRADDFRLPPATPPAD